MTAVWRSPDGNAIRYQFEPDDGVYEVTNTSMGETEVDDVPTDWVTLVPEPRWKHLDGTECDSMEDEIIYAYPVCVKHRKTTHRATPAQGKEYENG